MKKLDIDNPHCFVCGVRNEKGLQIDFLPDEDKSAFAEVSLPDAYEGYEGIIHGGIISTLLDEAMSKTIHFHDLAALTAELTVRFKNPLPAGEMFKVRAQVKEIKGRLIFTEASLILKETNQIIATADAKFLLIK
ncbi:MAG TPA: PaaI family thioesterase [Firmicutes bacterium]|nr:PaaI family thioesterase [Bacillota bacterium]